VIFEDDVLSVETIPLSHKIRCSGFLFREKPKLRRIDKTRLPQGLKLQQIADLKNGADVVDEQGNLLYKNEYLTHTPRKSRSYAYCSDTAYAPQIVQQISGVDILYHEATFMEEEIGKAEDTLHTTARQAGEIARQAGVDKLLLGHFSARYKDLTPLHNEALAVFGNTVMAEEGVAFTIQD
jgi:ribonuclease Z